MLAWVAGVLFVAEGFYLLTNSLALPFASVDLPTAGAVSAVAGLGLIFLGGFYRSYGEYRSYLGTLILLISACDIWFGGGFWAGSIIGAFAGALMLVLPPYGLMHDPDQSA